MKAEVCGGHLPENVDRIIERVEHLLCAMEL